MIRCFQCPKAAFISHGTFFLFLIPFVWYHPSIYMKLRHMPPLEQPWGWWDTLLWKRVFSLHLQSHIFIIACDFFLQILFNFSFSLPFPWFFFVYVAQIFLFNYRKSAFIILILFFYVAQMFFCLIIENQISSCSFPSVFHFMIIMSSSPSKQTHTLLSLIIFKLSLGLISFCGLFLWSQSFDLSCSFYSLGTYDFTKMTSTFRLTKMTKYIMWAMTLEER